jgi:hypothetical protein
MVALNSAVGSPGAFNSPALFDLSRASSFISTFGGEACGGTAATWLQTPRANARAVVKALSMPHKSVRLSKDSALPFMLFGTLDGTSLFDG